jgi:sulfate-transporting ATPase
MVPETAPCCSLAEASPVAFEGGSRAAWFEGDFETYEDRREGLLGAEADRRHRIIYRRLTRS